jgi:ATP-binding cassette subfamily B protein
MSKRFSYFSQHDAMDCGATCLRMIAKYYGKNYSLETLRERTYITREGVSMLGISEAAEKIGFHTLGIKASFEKLCEAPLPAIVHWKQSHFVVVYEMKIAERRKQKAESRRQKAERRTQNAECEENTVLHSAFCVLPKGTVRVADPAPGLIKYIPVECSPPSPFFRIFAPQTGH